MNYKTKITTAILALAVITTGCEKDDTPEPGPGGTVIPIQTTVQASVPLAGVSNFTVNYNTTIPQCNVCMFLNSDVLHLRSTSFFIYQWSGQHFRRHFRSSSIGFAL